MARHAHPRASKLTIPSRPPQDPSHKGCAQNWHSQKGLPPAGQADHDDDQLVALKLPAPGGHPWGASGRRQGGAGRLVCHIHSSPHKHTRTEPHLALGSLVDTDSGWP